MCRFIETIRFCDGEACNLPYHDRRLNATRIHFWPASRPIQLADYLQPPTVSGIIKARVVYGEKGIEEVGYTPYLLRHIQSLALIHSDTVDYTYKSVRRETLNHLFSERGTCDDILIVKHGLLTDTSIANIALFDGTHWYTPQQPLLKGTRRAWLLDKGILAEKELRCEDLTAFSAIRLFNAMIEWGEVELPVQNIITHKPNMCFCSYV